MIKAIAIKAIAIKAIAIVLCDGLLSAAVQKTFFCPPTDRADVSSFAMQWGRFGRR